MIRFKGKHLLQIHCKNQSENDCEMCKRKFCTEKELNTHMKLVCEPRTVDQNHAVMQMNDDPMKVDLNQPIAEQFNRDKQQKDRKSSSLQKNMSYARFECNECGRCFKMRTTLKSHMKLRHGVERRCSI